MALVEAVYRDTARFPPEEAFGLAEQIRHAAVAVPSRLAEGTTSDSIVELVRFLGMSCGSLAALQTQLEIAVRLGYLAPDASAVTRTHRLGTLVTTLRQSLADEVPRPNSGDDYW